MFFRQLFTRKKRVKYIPFLFNKKHVKSTRICVIAGEPSGDEIGANLIQSLEKKNKNIGFTGVGGFYMERVSPNFNSLFPISELSVMGFFEIILKFPQLYMRVIQLSVHIIKEEPHIVVTIDNKGFNKRVVKLTKKFIKILPGYNENNTKFIQYVAPSVWAFKNKVDVMGAYDHLFCILPFEKSIFNKFLPTTFVGHPSAECFIDYKKLNEYGLLEREKNPNILDQTTMLDQTTKLDNMRNNRLHKSTLSKKNHNLLLLPGSRLQEIKRIMPLIKTACDNIYDVNIQPMVISTADLNVEKWLEKYIKKWNRERIEKNLNTVYLVKQNGKNKFAILGIGDSAIATSGTVVTDLGLLGIPTTVVYKCDLLTEYLLKRMINKSIIKLNSVSLVNIIHEFKTNEPFNYLINDNKLIPELLFENCTSENISMYAKEHIYNTDFTLGIKNKKAQADDIYISMFPTRQLSIKPSEIAAKTIMRILSDMKPVE